MAKFQKIQGKTLEQISKNISKINPSDLVDFINEYGGKIAKSASRQQVVPVAQKLVDDLLAKKSESESKAKKTGKKAPAPTLSKVGWDFIVKMRECLKGWDDDSVSVEDMATELGHPEPTIQKTINRLEQDGFLIKTDGDKYALSDQGESAKKPGSKSKSGTATTARGATGPKSSLSGKKITRKAKENPSRPESKRGKAWGVITDGMTYEAYREAGGNAFDLNFFIGKGYATVK